MPALQPQVPAVPAASAAPAAAAAVVEANNIVSATPPATVDPVAPVVDSGVDGSNIIPAASASPAAASSAPAASANVDPLALPLTLLQLVELLRPMTDARVLLCPACPPDFLAAIALEVKDAVWSFLLSVRDDEDAMRAWSRRLISRPLVQVELLLLAAKSPHLDSNEIKRILEFFELEWSWAYARCKSLPLDRRISSLNDLKDSIDYVERKEEWFLKKKGASSGAGASVFGYVNAAVTSSLNGAAEPPPAYTKIWMNSEALRTWFVESKVLEELLEPVTAHVELIRRCLPIMRLLSMQPSTPAQGKQSSSSSSSSSPSLLTTHHLDLLWQLSCMGKHESIEHLIYDMVARLSSTLSVPLINHLFKRMCEKPFASYDTIYLTLIHSFTLNTLHPSSPVAIAAAASASKGVEQQTYGIDLLWTLLQSAHTAAQLPGDSGSLQTASKPPSPAPASSSASSSSPSPSSTPSVAVSSEVLLRARDLLLDLLALDSCVSLRSKFMDRCVSNVKSGILVSQSLHILLKIIQVYPLKSAGWFSGGSSQTQPAVIEALDEKYDLLNLVLLEMTQFQ